MREINSQEMEKIRMKNLTTPFRYDYVGSKPVLTLKQGKLPESS